MTTWVGIEAAAAMAGVSIRQFRRLFLDTGKLKAIRFRATDAKAKSAYRLKFIRSDLERVLGEMPSMRL